MEEIELLVWNGTLNVQIKLDSSLVIPDTLSECCLFHLRIPRESYLPMYLPIILKNFKNVIKIDLENYFDGWWYEYDGIPIDWNFPVGSLYDSLAYCNNYNKKSHNDKEIIVWNLTIHYSKKIPDGIIPLVDGLQQIHDFWMHQWKQSCFILNGSSKRVMSLPVLDYEIFWKSLLDRNYNSFKVIKRKITTKNDNIKMIPIKIHQILSSDIKIIQPCVPMSTSNYDLLLDVLKSELSSYFKVNDNNIKVIIQGIEIPLKTKMLDLYHSLSSFDGFLHISVYKTEN